MVKDIGRKARGSWWQGWVKFTYWSPLDQAEREGVRYTDWEFATAGQAKRAADSLAGAFAKLPAWQRRTVTETGASRVQ